MSITLQDAVFGAEKSLDVRTAVVCETCQGSCCKPGTGRRTCDVCRGSGHVTQVMNTPLGRMQTQAACGSCRGYGDVLETPCVDCQGQGRVQDRRTLSLKIPGGIQSGNRIQLRGQGEAGLGGGPAGDLYVEITVEEDERFDREGDDLHTLVAVPMTTAALGAEVTVDTLDGPQPLHIEAGTQPGTVKTLKGLGAKKLRYGQPTEERGDLKITVNVAVPTKLKGEEKKLLEELASLRGESDGGLVEAGRSRRFSKFMGRFGTR